MSITIFLNIYIISVCIIILNSFLFKNNLSLRRVGIKTIFIIFLIFMIRLFLPYPIPFPVTVTVPFPFIIENMNNLLSANLNNFLVVNILVFIWIFLSSVLLIKFIYINFKLLKFKRVLIHENQCSKELTEIFNSIKVELAIKKKVILVVSNHIRKPFMFGIFLPFVVIPNRNYIKSELIFILKHELNHIKTHDIIWKYSFQLLKIIYWWLPTIYVLNNQLVTYLEIRCDANCLKNEDYNTITNYLEFLLEESKRNVKNFNNNSLILPMYTNKNILARRFNIILSNEVIEKSNRIFVKLIIFLLLILSFGIVFIPSAH